MIVILIGAPGSGKGTQSQRLAGKYGFQHLATGDIFRLEIAQKTALGLKTLAGSVSVLKGETVSLSMIATVGTAPGIAGTACRFR